MKHQNSNILDDASHKFHNSHILSPSVIYHDAIACFLISLNEMQVWYEWCVTSPVASPIHNTNGRSYWVGL